MRKPNKRSEHQKRVKLEEVFSTRKSQIRVASSIYDYTSTSLRRKIRSLCFANKSKSK